MEALPNEIKVAIFILLPSLSALRACISTSKALNFAFSGAKETIIKHVVKNRLEPGILREIKAVSASLQIKTWNRDIVTQISASYFNTQLTMTMQDWDLRTALQIDQLQTLIKAFTADFASNALAMEPLICQNGVPPLIPTRSELERFERSFWRFELYCNLFRDYNARSFCSKVPPFSIDEQKAMFFDRMAPFENEQLGCVHDYLWDQISPAFDDVAAHDIEWGGEWSVSWVNDYEETECSNREGYLSQGLFKIKEIRDAKLYPDRCKVLDAVGTPNYPPMNLENLFGGLQTYPSGDPPHMYDISLEELQLLVRQPVTKESNPGPLKAWKWLHEDFDINDCFLDDNHQFRRRAYVMWDENRLLDWGYFRDGILDIVITRLRKDSINWEDFERQQESRRLRDEIYHRGGRGWWDFDDLSRVSWSEHAQRTRPSKKQPS